MKPYHMLHDLSPVITGWTICVLVVRVYKKIITNNNYELRCILVDESGDHMEAIIPNRYVTVYLPSIKQNQWKNISTFQVRRILDPVRATKHDLAIWFLDQTIVTCADAKETNIFNNFTPFDYIVEDTVPTNILVDLLGALVYVGNLTNSTPTRNDVSGYTLPFHIMDRNKVILKCEALGQTAIDFSSNYLRYGRPNVVIALQWWKILRPTWRGEQVKIVSHGTVSAISPEPSIEDVLEIKLVVD